MPATHDSQTRQLADTAIRRQAGTSWRSRSRRTAISRLCTCTRTRSAVLRQHMTHEENRALPLIQEVLTPKDWSAFRNAMARRQGPKGAAMYVPWIMDGAGAEDQRNFLNTMPAPVAVINRLVWRRR